MKTIMPYGLVRLLTVMLAALLLAACGGGGGSDDSIKAAPSVNTLTVTPHIIQVSRDGTSQVPATLNLTLTTPSGAPASGVVTFAVPSSVTVGTKNEPVHIGVSGTANVQVFAKTSASGTIHTQYTSGGGSSNGPKIKFTSTVSNNGDGGTTTPTLPLLSTISLTNHGNVVGTAAVPIMPSKPATVTVTLLQAGASTPIKDAVVNFSLNSGVGELGQTSALTNAAGQATLSLNAGNTQGAGTLIAIYATQSGEKIRSQVSFSVQINGGVVGTGPVLSTPSLLDAANVTVGTTANPITTTNSATVNVSLTDGGTPIVNKLVTFSLVGAVGQLDPITGTALTNGTGTASIKLKAGAKEGAGTLIATYSDGNNTVTSQVDFTTKGAGPVTQLTLALGSGSGTSFVAEKIALPVAAPAKAMSGSSYTITVNVADASNGNLFTQAPVEVRFGSLCASSGLATLSPAVSNSVGGTVLMSYSPKNGCKNDTITASATVNGVSLSATTPSFAVEQSPVSTISFVSASPKTIGLHGASAVGVEESSILTFEVKDQNGVTVGAGTEVKFSVQTPVGGFGISGSATNESTGTTNAAGRVSVTVSSGSVPMVGTIKAALVSNPSIYGTGSVSIRRGPATQDRFTLSIETLNPAAWNHAGTPDVVTVSAADRYGNWVPDGTTINFATKLGKIGSSCKTADGVCSVTWTSQGAQPLLFDANRVSAGCALFNATEWYRHGLAAQPWQMECSKHDRYGVNVITAWATGEESFSDSNGNNVFDDGEDYVDLGEAFNDNNLNGKDNAASGSFSEDYQDLDSSGTYNGPNGKYNGLSCDPNANSGCDNGLINVRRALTMVLSSDNIQMGVWSQVPLDLDVTTPSAFGQPAVLATSLPGLVVPAPTITVVVADMNGNAPPIGTKIEVKAKADDAALVKADIAGPKECTLGSSLGPLVCTFSLVGTTAGDDSGNRFTITTTSGGNANKTVTRVLTVP